MDDRNVRGLTSARALEVDHVQALGALILESLGHGDRIVVVDGNPIVVALVQPDDLTIEQIDRWNQLHATSPRKCPIKRAPACWLFSGWNWQARTLSRAIAEQNGPP